MTLEDSARGAVLPWNSTDREEKSDYSVLPQQKIDICLLCPLHASSCDKCDGNRKLKMGVGRPRIEVDTDLLREMIRLRRTNKEMCAELGINQKKLQREKSKILKEVSQ